ncbi:MAG: hypothetical protein RL442_2026, partial [Pseudomonadota bacterium]
MPLPPAPSKRAALLREDEFSTPARGASSSRKSATRAMDNPVPEKPQVLDLFERGGGDIPELDAELESIPSARTSSTKTSTATRHGRANTPASSRSAKRSPSVAASKRPRSVGPTKLFVLDTNVLMHDPMSLFRFEEHDIFLPMIVLEELDSNKKGMTEVARNARQASRMLDALAATQGADIAQGLSLDSTGHLDGGGRLYFQTQAIDQKLPLSLPQGKADNQILGVVQSLRDQHAPREVALVSKDINMRIKARALGLHAEDYQNDKTLEDGDLLYSGALALP